MTTSIPDQNVEIAKTLLDAFASGDIQLFRAQLAEEIEWTFPGPPGELPITGTFVGPEAVLQWLATLADDLEVQQFTPNEILAAGENVVVVFGSEQVKVRKSGKTYFTQFAHRLKFRSGKLIRFTEYTDTGSMMLARG